jgi:hypothetical protein
MKSQPILSSKDYKKFKGDLSNRDVTSKNLKKLNDSMKAYGWLPAYPMHVVMQGGNHVIKDGQHRKHIAEALGIPVLYVVCPDHEGLSISKINGAQAPWTSLDYVKSFCNQGNPHFTKLLNFSQSKGLPLGVSAKMLMTSTRGRSTCTNEIREGTFKVKNLDLAEKVADIIVRIKGIVPWAANSSFVSAVMKCCMIPEFSALQFLQRCEAHPSLLVLQPTTDQFLDLIEAIYNYRTTQSRKLAVKFLASRN